MMENGWKGLAFPFKISRFLARNRPKIEVFPPWFLVKFNSDSLKTVVSLRTLKTHFTFYRVFHLVSFFISLLRHKSFFYSKETWRRSKKKKWPEGQHEADFKTFIHSKCRINTFVSLQIFRSRLFFNGRNYHFSRRHPILRPKLPFKSFFSELIFRICCFVQWIPCSKE